LTQILDAIPTEALFPVSEQYAGTNICSTALHSYVSVQLFTEFDRYIPVWSNILWLSSGYEKVFTCKLHSIITQKTTVWIFMLWKQHPLS